MWTRRGAVEVRNNLLGLGLVVALLLIDLADVDDALGPGLLRDLDVARRDLGVLAAHARRGGTHDSAVCERRAVVLWRR
jgi:hypothetical protein